LDRERREKRKGVQGWNCSPIQIIKNDNHALFYYIFIPWKGERREKRKGVQGWNCSVFK
jgi:hypothetical protein